MHRTENAHNMNQQQGDHPVYTKLEECDAIERWETKALNWHRDTLPTTLVDVFISGPNHLPVAPLLSSPKQRLVYFMGCTRGGTNKNTQTTRTCRIIRTRASSCLFFGGLHSDGHVCHGRVLCRCPGVKETMCHSPLTTAPKGLNSKHRSPLT